MRAGQLHTAALCVPALIVAHPPGVIFAEAYHTVDEALQLAFPQADSFTKQRIVLSAADREALEGVLRNHRLPRLHSFYEARSGERLLGYGVVDNVIGKSQPITYMLALGPDLKVRSIEILVYRESHGFEVRQPAWRSQFPGLNRNSRLRLHVDVRNIAGATISCKAVTDGVHDLLQLMGTLITPQIEQQAVIEASATLDGEGTSAVSQVEFACTRLAMGTTLEIKLWANDEAAAQAAAEQAFKTVEKLEALLSIYRPQSELSRLNSAAGGAPLPISAETHSALSQARALAARTGGCFDPTSAPLVNLWKGADGSTAPGAADLSQARARVSWRDLELGPGTARLRSPGMSLDLGGVGKGFALDQAGETLKACGVTRALLNFGGNILALAPPPGESGWQVSLRDPRSPQQPHMQLELAHASLATSADYERGLEIDGNRVSHVVDPRSGRPTQGLLGASVLAGTATEADALSTALFVLGPEKGRQHAVRHEVAALLVPDEGAAWSAPSLERRRISAPLEASGR